MAPSRKAGTRMAAAINSSGVSSSGLVRVVESVRTFAKLFPPHACG